jgi:hypothetical protein
MSSSSVFTPALARSAAMPPPITPLPMTAAFLIFLVIIPSCRFELPLLRSFYHVDALYQIPSVLRRPLRPALPKRGAGAEDDPGFALPCPVHTRSRTRCWILDTVMDFVYNQGLDESGQGRAKIKPFMNERSFIYQRKKPAVNPKTNSVSPAGNEMKLYQLITAMKGLHTMIHSIFKRETSPGSNE